MIGCRPLTDREIEMVRQALVGRDRALFVLGVYSGFRISELLSLRIKDVVQHGELLDRVTVQRRSMKGKGQSRSVVLHPKTKEALRPWLATLLLADDNPHGFVFRSRKGQNRPISRVQAHTVLRDAFNSCQLSGRLGTHSMRKTFANRAFENSGRDLLRTAKALGHKSVNSTISYLSFKSEEIDDLVLAA